MRNAKIFIHALAYLSFSIGTLCHGAPADNIDNEPAHIVVLQYSPGDRNVTIQSIDGVATTQTLSVGPILHSAMYYAGFVLLAAVANYFKNAELLSLISMAGIPILAVVTVRDISRILQGGP